MKIIMYHYVRPRTSRLPYAFLSLDNFHEQLKHFAKVGNILSKDSFIEKYHANNFSKNDFLLTFDDGFIDHFQYVFPALMDYGATGIFYIPTDVISDSAVLDVHMVHHLLATVPDNILVEFSENYISSEMLSDLGKKEFKCDTYVRQVNSIQTSAFKRLVNYYIKPEYKKNFIDVVAHGFLDMASLHAALYVSKSNLIEMRNNSMIIGSHGCSHQLLSKLNPRSQKKEIVDSFLTLSNLKILSSEIKTFCYPYGGFHSFTDYTESLLGSLCVSFSVNVEPRDCTANDIELRPHALPRYDCNIFPFGKATFVHPPVA